MRGRTRACVPSHGRGFLGLDCRHLARRSDQQSARGWMDMTPTIPGTRARPDVGTGARFSRPCCAAAAARVTAQAPAGASRRFRRSPTPRDWSKLEPVPYPDPDIVALDPAFPPLHRLQHLDQAAAHRHVLGRGSRVERRRPVSRVERHPSNVQLRWIEDDARVTTFRNPAGLQQRQHVRLRGPAALVRARRTPRGAVRAERNRDDDRRALSRASG